MDEPCCDFRDHEKGWCECSDHPYGPLHPWGVLSAPTEVKT